MLKIAFLVPGTGISGGVSVILQHARWCQSQGHRVVLLFNSPVTPSDLVWHPSSRFIREGGIELATIDAVSDKTFDITLATYWKTFFDLWRVDSKAYGYLVQSIESRFFPGSQLLIRGFVDATYEFGVPVITVASWMREYLRKVHDTDALLVLNGIDKSIFRKHGPSIAPKEPSRLRVLVEGPTEATIKNVPRTVELCGKAGADEIWLMTGSAVTEWPGVDRVFSQIPQQKTAEIYRSCDVLVKLSFVEGMFGPPLEMFHCGGTSIVYDVTGHDEYIRNGWNGLVVPTASDDLVVRWIRELKDNRRLLEHLQRCALETAEQWPDWDTSSRQFAGALSAAMERPRINREMFRKLCRRLVYFANVANHSLAGLEEKLKQSSAALEQVQASSAALDQQIYALELAKEAMLNSTSWKVTAPLRELKQSYGRVVNMGQRRAG